MSNDPQARIGAASMEAADRIRELFGEDCTVGAVLIIADVIASRDDVDESESGDSSSTSVNDDRFLNPVIYIANDPRRWVQKALLDEAMLLAEIQNDKRIERALERERKHEENDDEA